MGTRFDLRSGDAVVLAGNLSRTLVPSRGVVGVPRVFTAAPQLYSVTRRSIEEDAGSESNLNGVRRSQPIGCRTLPRCEGRHDILEDASGGSRFPIPSGAGCGTIHNVFSRDRTAFGGLKADVAHFRNAELFGGRSLQSGSPEVLLVPIVLPLLVIVEFSLTAVGDTLTYPLVHWLEYR